MGFEVNDGQWDVRSRGRKGEEFIKSAIQIKFIIIQRPWIIG